MSPVEVTPWPARPTESLFCDTDPLLTVIWHRTLVGPAPSWLEQLADSRRYDLYLLLDIDVPWVNDGQRYFPDAAPRRAIFEQCEQELKRRNRPYVKVTGNWEERPKSAIGAIDRLLAPIAKQGQEPHVNNSPIQAN